MRSVDSLYKPEIKIRQQPKIISLKSIFVLLIITLSVGWSGSVFGYEKSKIINLKEVFPDGSYLVLFQNNAELRPSGGFIGSFARFDIEGHKVIEGEFETNIYKRDSAFAKNNYIEPPKPLSSIVDTWTMRDSNWDLDFRDAAQRVSWFYDQEGGEVIDGVIAVNASVLVDLLEVTGPINIDGNTIDSQNVLNFLHTEIEKNYFLDIENREENEPKSILRDLYPLLLARMKLPYNIPKLTRLFEQELVEKHIQLYHFDSNIQEIILHNGWAGNIKETEADYLLINNANLEGKKSSLNVFQEVFLDIAQNDDNDLLHNLTINRIHRGDGNWPDFKNNNYTRIALPLSTYDISVEVNGQRVDFDKDIERGKFVIGFDFSTDPKMKSVAEIIYSTPIFSNYSLTYQKQSGVLTDYLEVSYLSKKLFAGPVTTDVIVR